jgi:hypothetical protein
MLDEAQPFELMLNPFCCTVFLRVAHHHKRLVFVLEKKLFSIRELLNSSIKQLLFKSIAFVCCYCRL